MNVYMSPGEVVHIGDAVNLSVLAVEGDLVRFGLETPEGVSIDADDIGYDETDLNQKWNWWELN